MLNFYYYLHDIKTVIDNKKIILLLLWFLKTIDILLGTIRHWPMSVTYNKRIIFRRIVTAVFLYVRNVQN